MIDETLKKIPRDELVSYYDDEIQKYLVVYSKDAKLFYGISVKRFLEHKYEAALILNRDNNLHQILRRLRKGSNSNPEDLYSQVILFNYEDYLDDYKDDGYDLYINGKTDLILDKVKYSITFQAYPYIKEIVKAGYSNLATDIINHYNLKELSDFRLERLKIDKQSKEFLNKYKRKIDWWISLDKINRIDNVTFEQLQFFHQNSVHLYDLYCLLKNNSVYTVKSVIDYINHCAIYQGYKVSLGIAGLYGYLNIAKKIYAEVNYYPNDLKKEYNYASIISEDFRLACRRDIAKRYHYSYKRRIPYEFRDDNYYIKSENDIEHIKQISKLFCNYNITEAITNESNYYFIYDAKTDKEIALINDFNFYTKNKISNKVIKYDNRPVTRKEKAFINKWLNHKKNIELYSAKQMS